MIPNSCNIQFKIPHETENNKTIRSTRRLAHTCKNCRHDTNLQLSPNNVIQLAMKFELDKHKCGIDSYVNYCCDCLISTDDVRGRMHQKREHTLHLRDCIVSISFLHYYSDVQELPNNFFYLNKIIEIYSACYFGNYVITLLILNKLFKTLMVINEYTLCSFYV